jgi:hypothetical protein
MSNELKTLPANEGERMIAAGIAGRLIRVLVRGPPWAKGRGLIACVGIANDD